MKKLLSIVFVSALFLGLATPTLGKDETAPPLVRQLYNGNWPSDKEAQELRDELYYQRAIHSYMTMQPAMNVIGMRDGSEGAFGKGYNVLPIWKDRMDARAWVPTPNADVIYSMSYLDLKETGPLVVAAPAHVIGMFTDFFQRTITDVGAIGPDRARGGLYLLLPPDYQGHVPAGYFTFRSSTYNVFLFFRTVLVAGKDGPDTGPAVATAERTRIYPLWEEEKNLPAMKFPNGSGKRVNMMYPTDFSYWEKLKAFVDYEHIDAITPELRGVLASIGIIKGQPFQPTTQQRKLLERAVVQAPKMILAMRKAARPDGRDLYYHDRQYLRVWAGATAEFMQASYLDVDVRAGFFQYAYSSAPAMVMRTIGAGSKYPVAFRDADGDILNGSHQYKLHMPAGIPAKAFWAVTLYNITDGTMPETKQLMPSTNGYEKVSINSDGSIDLYFGPSKPSGVADKNWIQTVEGRDFMAVIRLYGADIEFFDQTWKPDDVVKMKLGASALAGPTVDRFYLPQPDQPFEGKVDTRIGTLEFSNQYPSKESMESILDNMDFHGATQAYLWGIPIASFANMQYYHDKALKMRQGDPSKYQSLDQKLGILTGNATTPYIFATADLTKTGPFVIELPPGNTAGMVDDFWQRPITDMGLPGPDKGKGAKYLITPPGYDGEKPDGYRIFESPTNNVFWAIRLLDSDQKVRDALQAKVKAYAYKDRANPSKNLFPAPSAKYFFGPPRGMAFWERLHEILNREVVADRDRFFMAMLKRVGIEKGKPFNPNPRQKKLLEEAAFVGEAMAKANDLTKRSTEPYWKGANWKIALGLDPTQRQKNYDQLDERAEWMYEAVTTSAGMVTTTPGVGSIYLASYADKDGDWLEGGKSYTLHIPGNPPAKQFWSVAVYSWDTRTLIDNKQKRAAQSSRQDLIKNADGSIDLYYGPTAPKGKEKNWVQTIPGQGWWVYLRFYAPTKEYFDKSWSMGDFEKRK